ncbi:MAG: DUF2213 domain-containing protein [Gracilibacteraceae bacterium]|jgi:hypothetical protein|nr:DUF2213 domain-containing protein [Gracilibacteraceae bacterium]
MRYHTTGSLSEHIKQTPEGYLLCLDVPIARLGAQEYLPEEVPFEVEPGQETVKIYRMEADVFAGDAVASFEGKPVTLDHPEEHVTPDTWRELSRGLAQNLRRGEGADSDLLLADLLITDAEAIAAVRGGLREISSGYDADYEETAPGVGRQTNIIGNHIALVDRGRCGPRCKIRDTTTEIYMGKGPKPGFWDRIFRNPKVLKAMDEASAEAEKAPPKDPPAREGVTADDDRITALEGKLDEVLLALRALSGKGADEDPEQTGDEDPEKTGDEDPNETGDEDPDSGAGEDPRPTGDRKRARGSLTDGGRRVADKDTVRRAKIIAPGSAARVGDSLCAVMRHALRAAMNDKALAPAINNVLRGETLDKADCLTLDAAFVTASEIAGSVNNKRTADGLTRRVSDFGRSVTPEDINKANREYYARSKQ